MDSFDGKLAVVTGGGSGMGRELVRQLAELRALDLEAVGRGGLGEVVDREDAQRDRTLYDKAMRYHAAVRRLRGALRLRAGALTGLRDSTPECAPIYDRYAGS